MVERTLCQESAGGNCACDGDRDHYPRDYSRGSERDWMRRDNFFAEFDGCILWRGDFRRRDRRAVLWATDGQRLRRSSSARSVFSAGAHRNLSARASVNRYFLAILGGKSQSSLPFRDGRSTSTSATPPFESLSDAPVKAAIVLVKSGS